jgi:hypothetical protein
MHAANTTSQQLACSERLYPTIGMAARQELVVYSAIVGNRARYSIRICLLSHVMTNASHLRNASTTHVSNGNIRCPAAALRTDLSPRGLYFMRNWHNAPVYGHLRVVGSSPQVLVMSVCMHGRPLPYMLGRICSPKERFRLWIYLMIRE